MTSFFRTNGGRAAARASVQRTRLNLEALEPRLPLSVSLSVTEINYQPYPAMPQFGDLPLLADEFEFIELQNTGSSDLNLKGVRLARLDFGNGLDGVAYRFGAESLAPQERIVVVENPKAFRSRYGRRVRVADAPGGKWVGRLGNRDETLTLLDSADNVIQQFRYDTTSAWPQLARGQGFTLEVKNVAGDLNDPSNWRNSVDFGGSPGRAGSDAQPTIVVNEVLVHSDPSTADSVELANTTDAAIDVGGLYLTDSLAEPTKYRIPAGTSVGPHAYLVLGGSDAGSVPLEHLALNPRGGELFLLSVDNNGRPSRLTDHAQYDAALAGVSMGRLPDGDPASDLLPLAEPTLGQANLSHREGQVVISEIHYNPAGADNGKEFVELTNTTSSTVDIGGWWIEDAVSIAVPGGTQLGPGQSVVVVGFDPNDVTSANAFRSSYGIGTTVALIGPWATNAKGIPQSLSNQGEKVVLLAPVDVDETTAYRLVDQVVYDDHLPWPTSADGKGKSLNRRQLSAFGNAAANWQAAAPTPGSYGSGVEPAPAVMGDANRDGRFDRNDIVRVLQGGKYLSGQPATWEEGDWNVDGVFNQLDLVAALRTASYSP